MVCLGTQNDGLTLPLTDTALGLHRRKKAASKIEG